MTLFHLTPADWIILCAYLFSVLAIGVFASRKIKGTDSYFLGGRRFGKITMIAQSFGTGTHAEMPVSLAGIVYTMGLSGIWYQWKNLFVTPFYWLIAPLFRRFRRTTMAEVVEDRYGPWMGAIYTVFALGFFTINMASMLKGAAKVIDQATGGAVPVNFIVVGMPCIFLAYSLAGGLVAAAWTEVLQGLLILVLSFMVIPLGWHAVNGLAGIKDTLGATKMSLVVPDGIGVWFILALTVNGLVGIVAQPHLIAAVGTGKNEEACRAGQLYGNLIKRFCTIGWAVVALIAATTVTRGMFGTTALHDPEDAFGFACRHFLFPGGIGLLVASLLAANMAGCSAFVVNVGALATNGLYRRYIYSSGNDQHYLRVGRLAGLLVTIAAVLYAVFLIQRVLYAFLLTETMATFIGIGILGGVIWRRANRWGALASIVTSIGINFSGYAFSGQRLDFWSPAIFAAALGGGIIAFVGVSLLTAPEPVTAMDTFYSNLQTPTDEKDRAIVSSAVAARGQQLIVVNLLHPRKGAAGESLLRAYHTDLRGFLIGFAIVLALIGATALVFS